MPTHTNHSSFSSYPFQYASLYDSIFCAFWFHFLVMFMKIELFLPQSIFYLHTVVKFARSMYYPLLACVYVYLFPTDHRLLEHHDARTFLTK